MYMDDVEHTHQENMEDGDFGVQITNLEPSDFTHPSDTIKYRLSRHIAEKLQASPPLLRRGKTRIAVTSTVALVGLIILLSVSGVFSALLATIAHPAHPHFTTITQQSLILTSHVGQEDGLSCLMDAAWSPDSSQVAVLGYATDCPNSDNQHEAGLLNLYNARTAKLIAHLHPDSTIGAALKKQVPQWQNSLVINYSSVLWSSHGQEIAVSFSANPFINGKGPSFIGLLLITQSRQQQVFLRQFNGTILTPSYLIWDMQRGTVSEVPNAAPSQSSFPEDYFNIPGAVTYHWSANGRLLPGFQPGSSDSANSPVGNPVGDPTFSIWQPGTAEWTAQNGNGTIHLPGVYVWQTFFSAWSPDGRYLAEGLATGALLHIPGQKPVSRQALKDLGVDQLATIQVLNTSLIHLLRSLSSSSLIGSPSGAGANVSWRPDGRVVAVDNAGTVTIYNCSTGRELATLVPQHLYPLNLDGGTGDVLRWSPDGTHLFLASTTWGLSIWGPGQLPK
jgi:hypothetical protein